MRTVSVVAFVFVSLGKDPVAVRPLPPPQLFEAFEGGDGWIQFRVEPGVPHVVLGDAEDEVGAVREKQPVEVAIAQNESVVDRLPERRQGNICPLKGFGIGNAAAFLGSCRAGARAKGHEQHGYPFHFHWKSLLLPGRITRMPGNPPINRDGLRVEFGFRSGSTHPLEAGAARVRGENDREWRHKPGMHGPLARFPSTVSVD